MAGIRNYIGKTASANFHIAIPAFVPQRLILADKPSEGFCFSTYLLNFHDRFCKEISFWFFVTDFVMEI